MNMSIGNFEVNIQDLLNAGNKGEIKKLEEGQYDSVIVGAITRKITDKLTQESRDVFEFIFQVVEEGTIHYVRSKDMKLSTNEKSSYFEFLKSYFKLSGPLDATFKPKLYSSGIVSKDEKLTLPNHFGLPVKLTLSDNVATNGKTYLRIINYGKCKVDVSIKPDAIPEGLVKWDPNNQVILAEGMTIKPRAVQASATTNSNPSTPTVNSTETKATETKQDDSWLDA